MSQVSTADVEDDAFEGLDGFLTFEMDGDRYAITLSEIDEIVRVPKITPVPLAPAALRGVANLDGAVVPVADLRQCCGLPARPTDSSTRVLVVHTRGTLGLIVDRVASVNAGSADELDDAGLARSAVGAELVAGVLRDSGSTLTTVLDLPLIIDREFAPAAGSNASGGRVPLRSLPFESDANAAVERVLSFVSAGREYAIHLDSVNEIIRVPPTVVPVPHPLAGVLGLVDLRGRVVPLFDSRVLLGVDGVSTEPERAIVLRIGSEGIERVAALAVDSVRDVSAAEAAAFREVPVSLATSDRAGVERVCALDGRRRLVPVLSVESLLGDLVAQVRGSAGDEEVAVEQSEVDADDAGEDEQLIGFVVGAVRYAVPVDEVREIVRHPREVTRIPDVPSFVVGLCNLKGEVLPLIDMSLRLGGAPIGVTESTRVLVAACNWGHLGVIVDAVTDVRRVAMSDIASPSDMTGRDTPFISGIVRAGGDDELVLVVSADALLDGTDLVADGRAR